MSFNKNLRTRFYDAYDVSYVMQFISKLATMPEAERRDLPGFLGEGTHFQSFELDSLSLPLAINVGKTSFARRGESALSRWKEAVRVAQSLESASLVPPMDVINAFGLTVLVMPRGKVVSKSGAKVVDALLQDTAKALGQAGLVLDDYPQIREAEGVPFIIDWSDLGFLNR